MEMDLMGWAKQRFIDELKFTVQYNVFMKIDFISYFTHEHQTRD